MQEKQAKVDCSEIGERKSITGERGVIGMEADFALSRSDM